MGKLNLRYFKDTTLDDSDKSWVVPAGEWWELSSVWVEVLTTATAGSRVICIEAKDAAGVVVWRMPSQYGQAASLTYNYLFAPGLSHQNTNVLPGITNSLPKPAYLLPGWTLRVFDVWAIDVALDHMLVFVTVNVHSI